MIHALIVSPRGCGASQLVQRILTELGRPVAGYVTVKEDALADQVHGSPIYIYEPGKVRAQTQENLVGYCKKHIFSTIPGAFDRHSSMLLAPVPEGGVLLMDVIGFMEAREGAFRQAILDRLDGEVPVIAVVKDKEFPFLDAVRSHPKCRCFGLNQENGEEIFRAVLGHMRRQLAGGWVADWKEDNFPARNLEDLNYFVSIQESTFPESPQYTPQRWDRRAELWDAERKQQRRDDERVVATMEYLMGRGILTPGCQVADIGCGPGRFVAAFAQKAGQVVGLDISQRMVARGQEYIQSLALENAQIRCCDFTQLDIEQEGYNQAFDLVFSSLTPAIHNMEGLFKAMEMSRAWCLNINHLRRHNHLREQILRDVFHRSPRPNGEGRGFYALFNILFLMGYGPETSYFTRRKEKLIRPDQEYVEFILEHSLPLEEHTPENARKIQRWLECHAREDGTLMEISDAVYGRILWDVRQRTPRPDYRRMVE